MTSPDDQIALLKRRCERILSEEDLRRKLVKSAQTNKPLRIKMGMDPTAPDVTLGHAVPLRIIRQFQDWGHLAVIIIGDVTGAVGDPSGANSTRPMLSSEQIQSNAKTYVQQVQKILLHDSAHLEVRYNGEWLKKLDIFDLIRLSARKTVGQMLQRDSFRERFDKNEEIRLHEFIYPLLQGWDSVAIDADVEMGGSDQLFNNLVGREFQHELGKEPQVVIVTPLLVGLDGVVKMSKSKKNYIGVTDPPTGDNGMFGKLMSIPDNLMPSYFTLLTDLPESQYLPLIANNPRDAKMLLARTIVQWMHSPQASALAQQDWDNRRDGLVPADVPEFPIPAAFQQLAPLLVLAQLVPSNAEAIRKIKEGAVSIDGEKVLDHKKQYQFDKPAVLKLGRRFARLIPQVNS